MRSIFWNHFNEWADQLLAVCGPRQLAQAVLALVAGVVLGYLSRGLRAAWVRLTTVPPPPPLSAECQAVLAFLQHPEFLASYRDSQERFRGRHPHLRHESCGEVNAGYGRVGAVMMLVREWTDSDTLGKVGFEQSAVAKLFMKGDDLDGMACDAVVCLPLREVAVVQRAVRSMLRVVQSLRQNEQAAKAQAIIRQALTPTPTLVVTDVQATPWTVTSSPLGGVFTPACSADELRRLLEKTQQGTTLPSPGVTLPPGFIDSRS